MAPVGLTIRVTSPLELSMTDAGFMTAKAHISYRLQWQDERFSRTACRTVLSELLSVSASSSAGTAAPTVKTSASTNYWLPYLTWDELSVENLVSSRFSFADNTSWLLMDPHGVDTNCSNCATFSSATVVTIEQPFASFRHFTNFPFDTHEVVLRASLPSSDIFNCSSAFSTSPSSLLPTTNEWILHGVEPVTVSYATDEDTGLPMFDMCEIRIRLMRRAFVFVVKQMSISVIVAYGGMLSLYMHPAEHTGDRGALVLVAALIIITAMQTDKGLGTLTYLIWFDYFSLMLICLLALALIETMVVHQLYTTCAARVSNPSRATRIPHPIQPVLLLLSIHLSPGLQEPDTSCDAA
jgi:hypothetical protein